MDIKRLLLSQPMKHAKVLAGSAGLSRIVTWCITDDTLDFQSWVMPGSLVIYSGDGAGYDFEREISYCVKQKVSAIVVVSCPQFVSRENIARCEASGMPVIKVPDDTNVSVLIRKITTVLNEGDTDEERMESWLKDLVFLQRSKPKETVAEYYGWDRHYDYVCLILRLGTESSFLVDEGRIEGLKSVVASYFSGSDSCPLSFVDRDSLVMFVPITKSTKPAQLRDEMTKLVDTVRGVMPGLDVQASMGSVASTLEEIPTSYYNAQSVHRYSEIIDIGRTLASYDDYALQMLYLSADREELARQSSRLLRSILGNEDLLRTLEVYLAEGENGKRASERLFVHPSTLRYRLQKIEKLTGKDLSDSDDRFQLRLALLATSYLSAGNAEQRVTGGIVV